ncbi:MAG: hypothetical protein ACM3Q2_09775 [Syntrophothermus sp.]
MFTQDDSRYFRGLLTLAAIDQNITEREKEFIISIGKKLGFEREFCNESLNGMLYNKYIDRSVPVFSDATLSQNFLQDCYRLALIDKKLDLKEIEWLNNVATKNNIQPLIEMKDN